MTTTTRNESAERLQDWINGDDPREWKAAQPNKWLDEALAAERRATVEKVRVALKGRGFSPISDELMEWIGWRLDEVAE